MLVFYIIRGVVFECLRCDGDMVKKKIDLKNLFWWRWFKEIGSKKIKKIKSKLKKSYMVVIVMEKIEVGTG